MDSSTPVIVTGGETGCGEVLRGDILHIDFDEATANDSYAIEALEDACAAKAHPHVIEWLVKILKKEHRVATDALDSILTRAYPDAIEPIAREAIDTIIARGTMTQDEAERAYEDIETNHPNTIYETVIGPVIDQMEEILKARREGDELE